MFVFSLPAIFWLILGIINILERNIYTKIKLIPLPIIIHAVSVISLCFIYLYFLFLSDLRSISLRVMIGFCFALLFMATYEFFYWIFLISNLNFDISRINYLGFPDISPVNKKFSFNHLPLKFFKISIFIIVFIAIFLFFINKNYNFLNAQKINIYISLFIFIFFLIIMIILRQQGFFIKTLFWFTGFMDINPHNLLWVLSKLLAMLMFLPIIKIKHK
ncbi:MAG: hypothetical protein KatS3mg095_0625 [Candidatus Parcubacteria bacterium]|nr:MAG: hypothetical protein KatS3mg095_0625 [Candidatus Parcubacteria bacterium]